ncbi:MAG: type II toxin-antitoxin system VapC family toxin [Caldilineae bacterium]|nr:MAG: type II toxin-antitoxin system VapC family toxin [Caldilineae bacterium]
MPSASRPLVVDTNILIDLHRGEVIEACFRLPFRFLIPDVIAAECKTPPASMLIAQGWLEEVTFSGEEVAQVVAWAAQWPRVSVNDFFALLAAMREQAILLTGDKALRRVARRHGVDVHGIFWLLEQMVVHYQILSPSNAAQALRSMRMHGSRLPNDLYTQYLDRWGAS